MRTLINILTGGSVADFARKFGFSEPRLSQLLSTSFRGGQNFGEKMARKIEQQCDVGTLSLDAIPDNEVEASGGDQRMPRMRVPNPDTDALVRGIAAPLVDIQVVELKPDGDGSRFKAMPLLARLHRVCVGVPIDWMRQNNLKASQLIATKIQGDSMEPTLFAEDVVVADSGQIDPVDGAVFLCWYEGASVIRRLTRDAGEWWLTADADQRRYPRKIFDTSVTGVVGRVVFKQSFRI